MACGRPVLAAQARALPELVKHQVNGYLFESNNPADAAEGMRWLIDHLEDWPKMSAASLEITKGHEMRNTVARYEACYREVIGRVLAPRV